MSGIFSDNSMTIGDTPLVRLSRIGDGNLLAKLESRNPANSVKCRIGANMIWEAEKSGALKPGMTVVEATSGNTGIALAFVAASRGYGAALAMPSSFSLERRQVMSALGAELILTDPAGGIAAAIKAAEDRVASDPSKYISMKQFENPANPAIHEKTTGPEIWEATKGEIDVLVSGVGTGGTITGISRYIKQTQKKAITSVAVEPIQSTTITDTLAGRPVQHAPHKIQGIGAGFIPGNLDLSMVDQVELIDEAVAMDYAHRLMCEEGILAGISSGAAIAAAVNVSQQDEHRGKMIVAILPDSGERYLSTALFAGRFGDAELVQ